MENIAAVFLEYARLDRRRTAEGLSPAQTARWRELKKRLDERVGRKTMNRLTETEEPPSSAERRESVRTPSHLECSFDSLGSFRRQLITNLSRGGVFIQTEDPLPLGTKLKLRIHIESPNTNLDVESVVVSNNAGSCLSPGTRGMGVRFSHVGPEIISQICDLYEREIERAFGPAAGDRV